MFKGNSYQRFGARTEKAISPMQEERNVKVQRRHLLRPSDEGEYKSNKNTHKVLKRRGKNTFF